MEYQAPEHQGWQILRRLRALALARESRGDRHLHISPNPEPQEFTEFEGRAIEATGLVLEPVEGAEFEVHPLRPRQKRIAVEAFCDGTRATYFVGFEDVYPLMYTENRAAVRLRDANTGYHQSSFGIQRGQATLLAPFGMLEPGVRLPYEKLGLCPTRYADLCWFGDGEEFGPSEPEMRHMGSVAWQGNGQRRARRLMEISEQITSLAAARMVRERWSAGEGWLLKDGSLFQFDRMYLKQMRERERLRQIVGLVKSHPVPFFGVVGERALAGMCVGERSVAFLPRPPADRDGEGQPARLVDSPRPMVCWYLRVRDPEPQQANRMSGIVRLDIAATDDWQVWVDELSWAVLDEFYGLSALPDPRADVMPFGIRECEQFLRVQRLPGELILAALAR
jgi:hypothetical protein